MALKMYFTRSDHQAFVREVMVTWHPTACAYEVFCPACGPIANRRTFALVRAAYDLALNHRIDHGAPIPRDAQAWGPSSKWGPSSGVS